MKVIKNISLTLGTLLFILILVEGVGWIVLRFQHREKTDHNRAPGMIITDSVLGYKPAPRQVFRDMATAGKELIYEVEYTIDEHSRRVTPAENRTARNRYALFFGGSHTFGEGLADDEPLPYFFGAKITEYVPYNYGFMGYGPQQMLTKLYLSAIETEVSEKEGVAFFLYIGHWHVYRAIGEMVVSNGWGDRLPYFTIAEDDRLVCHGSFHAGRPILSRVYEMLGTSRFVQAFGITFPPFLREKHYRLTARIIQEARDQYESIFDNDNFYVIISPATHPDHRASSVAIIPHLEAAGIKYLDYSRLFSFDQAGYHIPHDGHPSRLANQTIAARLAADIRRMESF